MQRTVWLLIALLAVPPMAIASQSFEEWMESRDQEVDAFREERDRQFHNFLSEQWEAFEVYRGDREDETPKPDTIPRAPSDDAADEPGPPPADAGASEPVPLTVEPEEVTPPPQPEGLPEQAEAGPEAPGAPESRPPEAGTGERIADFRFLGHKLSVSVPEAWYEAEVDAASESGAAAFWADFAQAEAGSAVDELRAIRERLRLNGWGYLRLVQELARSVHGEGNTAVAFAWGVMLKSGHDIRMGYADGEMMLLFRSPGKLFEIPYFQLEGQRYYLLGHAGGTSPQIRTYRADYEGASEAVDVALRESPRTAGDQEQRALSVRYKGEQHRFQVPVDTALIEYLRTLPQQAVGAYFRTRPQSAVEAHLVKPLRRVTAEMERAEQVDFLLRLVQTAFDYRTDQEQFGREDYLYPEETLYYPASDCEDRSVLFAWLVRRVLDLEVAALDYPGHVATAVSLEEGNGVQVRINGRSLTVADPTYINARAGMVMPEFRDQRPEVIPLW